MPRRRDARGSNEVTAEHAVAPGTVTTPADVDIAAALRRLSEQVAELQQALEALREQRPTLPERDVPDHGWDAPPTLATSGPLWARSLESPSPRRLGVPRLALESAFLVAVAILVAGAGLEPLAIVGALAAAWALVGLGELLAWRSTRRDSELLAQIGLAEPRPGSDLGWLAPPLERTAELDEVAAPTAKLPPPEPE